MSAEAALEAALLDRLAGDAAVSAALGAPLRRAGEDGGRPAFPHVEIGGHEVRPAGASGVEAREHVVDLWFHARAGGREAARAVLDASRRALGTGGIALPAGFRCVLCLPVFADTLRLRSRIEGEPEVRAVLRLRAIVEEE